MGSRWHLRQCRVRKNIPLYIPNFWNSINSNPEAITLIIIRCIPKKLMHQAAILGQSVKDAAKFGWELPENGSISNIYMFNLLV